MNASRRNAVVFAAGLLALLLGSDFARSAEEKPAVDAVAPWGLVSDAHAGLQLAAAAEYIKDEDWKTAIRLLQHLLDGQQDTLARIAGTGRQTGALRERSHRGRATTGGDAEGGTRRLSADSRTARCRVAEAGTSE